MGSMLLGPGSVTRRGSSLETLTLGDSQDESIFLYVAACGGGILEIIYIYIIGILYILQSALYMLLEVRVHHPSEHRPPSSAFSDQGEIKRRKRMKAKASKETTSGEAEARLVGSGPSSFGRNIVTWRKTVRLFQCHLHAMTFTMSASTS